MESVLGSVLEGLSSIATTLVLNVMWRLLHLVHFRGLKGCLKRLIGTVPSSVLISGTRRSLVVQNVLHEYTLRCSSS